MTDSDAFARWLREIIARAVEDAERNPTVEGVAFLARLLDLGGLPKITPPDSSTVP